MTGHQHSRSQLSKLPQEERSVRKTVMITSRMGDTKPMVAICLFVCDLRLGLDVIGACSLVDLAGLPLCAVARLSSAVSFVQGRLRGCREVLVCCRKYHVPAFATTHMSQPQRRRRCA